MKAAEVVSSLKARGVELWQDGGTLRYRAPTGALTERERSALRAHKAAILRALAPPPIGTTATSGSKPVAPALAVTEPLPNRTEPPEPGSTQPFGQRELDAIRNGAGCWVWSGVLECWLFWVRDEERRRKALERGIESGCIWTLPEITGLVGMPAQDLRNIASIKRKFGGAIVPGAVPAQWRNALNPLEPAVSSRPHLQDIPAVRTEESRP